MKGKKVSKKIKETYPHFRLLKYKEGPANNKRRHPKIIIERIGDSYDYMGMTESAKRGRHSNIPLSQNPKRGDKSAAYVRKELRNRSVDDFMGILHNYNLSESDKQKVLDYAKKLKKKK